MNSDKSINSDQSIKPNVSELRSTINKINLIIKRLDKEQIFGSQAREDYFCNHHADIIDNYPFLVLQLISGTDNTMLEIMLKELDQVEKGMKTNDTAEKLIGEQLADQYLKK